MSERLSSDSRATRCQQSPHSGPEIRIIPGRKASLGPTVSLHRLLPRRALRMVGPWCFLDHIGPFAVAPDHGLDVAPHPHIGLHTVTWLLEGEILHRDSLGNTQRIRPGQLNLMTAGRGISHSEESPSDAPGRLHGIQLWLAQPEQDRHGAPDFQHLPELPEQAVGDGRLKLFLGRWNGLNAGARLETAVTAAELSVGASGRLDIPLDPAFEYALTPLDAAAEVESVPLAPGSLADLGIGRQRVDITAGAGERLLLIGGAPFQETILMWWNFVARDPEEIAQARDDWMRGEHFGQVADYPGKPLDAPVFEANLRKP